jgi:LSD1 subclass zinc finger protein
MPVEHNLTCSGCGDTLVYEPGQKALKCESCGTVNNIDPDDEDVAAITAQYIIPLSVDKAQLRSATHEYMNSGDYTPDDILDYSEIVLEKLSYLPAYWVQGSFTADWEAEFGKDEKVLIRTETRTVNGRSQRVPVYRNEIDWDKDSGEVDGEFSVAAYAGNGKYLPYVVSGVENTLDQGTIKEYSSSFTAGCDVEVFTRTRNDVGGSLDDKINAVVRRRVKSKAKKDHQRNWKWETTLKNVRNSTIFLPLAQSVFTYKGSEYSVWLDGVTGNRIDATPLPKDTKRYNDIHLGYIPFIVASLLFIFAVIFADKSNYLYNVLGWPLGGLSCALAFGFLRHRNILGFSKKTREVKLAQRTLQNTDTGALSEEEMQHLNQSATMPPPPLLADTSRDRLLLPLVSLLSAFLVFLPLLEPTLNDILSKTELQTEKTRNIDRESSGARGGTFTQVSPQNFSSTLPGKEDGVIEKHSERSETFARQFPKNEPVHPEVEVSPPPPLPKPASPVAPEAARETMPTPPLPARQRVRQYLQEKNVSPEGAMALFRTIIQSPESSAPETQDALYRLLYYASLNGNVEATLTLARYADPTQAKFGSISKDAYEAWRRYKAVVNQRPDVVQDMQALKSWLESEASKGNEQARKWIETIGRDGVR